MYCFSTPDTSKVAIDPNYKYLTQLPKYWYQTEVHQFITVIFSMLEILLVRYYL